MKHLIQEAYSIAEKAHKGQKRWGGEPYFTHPLSVGDRFNDSHYLGIRCKIVGYLHDIIEDSDYTIEDLEKGKFPLDILRAINTITRSKKKSYYDYILRVQKNDIAALVKISDLTHNLEDVLKFKKTYYRDRNLLARHILMQRHGKLYEWMVKK